MSHFRFPVRQIPTTFQEFANDLENIVEQVFQKDCKNGACENGTTVKFVPAMDVCESENSYDVYLDLPGVATDAVKLEMHEDRLKVSGTRAAVATAEGTTMHRTERCTGEFARSIRLPKQVDAANIQADFKNGVLHILLPKQAKPAPRTIEIRVAE